MWYRMGAVLGGVLLVFGGWAYAQDDILRLRVVALDAGVTSIQVPYGEEWLSTGPIEVRLWREADPRETVTTISIETGRGTIVWPVVISCPLFRELGIEGIKTIFVGTITVFPGGKAICVDDAHIEIPLPGGQRAEGDIKNTNHLRIPALIPGPVEGEFEVPTRRWDAEFLRQELLKSFELLARKEDKRLPFPAVDELIGVYMENFPREIVVYFPDANNFQSADLTGTFVIELLPAE